MTNRIFFMVLGVGLASATTAEENRPPVNPDYSHTNQDHFGSPGGRAPMPPKGKGGPDYSHTNQDGMEPPEDPPEGPPDGEESRLGDPNGFPFEGPNPINESVLVVAERLGSAPSPLIFVDIQPPRVGSSLCLQALERSAVPSPAGLLLFFAAGRGLARRRR